MDADAKANQIAEITHLPLEQCRQLLEQAGGRVDHAVELGLVMTSEDAPPQPSSSLRHRNNAATPPRTSTTSASSASTSTSTSNSNDSTRNSGSPGEPNPSQHNTQGNNAGMTQWLSFLLYSLSPFTILQVVGRFIGTITEIFLPMMPSIDAWLGARGSLEDELQSIVRNHSSSSSSNDTSGGSTVTSTARQNPLTLPTLNPYVPADLIDAAKATNKPVLLYVHSKYHASVPAFVRETLCAEAVVQYINENFIFTGCMAHDANAYKISRAVGGIVSYPYMAVLAPNGTRLEVIGGILSSVTADQLLAHLATLHETAQVRLVAEQARREEVRQTQILRQQQESEYEESLRRDREKERKRREEQEKEEELRRQQEAEEALKQQKETELMERIESAVVPPEPTEEEERIRIAVKLPGGKRVTRYFRPAEKVEVLFNFVYSQGEEEITQDIEIKKARPAVALEDKQALIGSYCPNNQPTMFVCHFVDGE